MTACVCSISIKEQCENFIEIQVVFQTYANWTSNLWEPSSSESGPMAKNNNFYLIHLRGGFPSNQGDIIFCEIL